MELLEAETIARYPGYFYTKKEISSMEMHKMSHEKIEPSSEVYHACCKSISMMINYTTLLDIQSKTVTLADFNERKQYFPTESCNSVSVCRCDCGCAMVNQTFTAVVHNPNYPTTSPEPLILWYVQAPTFCRCFNNLAVKSNVHITEQGETLVTGNDEL
ncbi:hypothetical protein Btru_065013 [Bulinus truncatus]|nr:hypothetical protein Btru_065013 [Bulinus truncatus]